MVICLMRIGSRSRKIVGIFDAILVFFMILSATVTVLLKLDKVVEFYSLGIFAYFSETDPFVLHTYFIVGALLLGSIFLLIHVFDVTVSQESRFHVEPNNASTAIYLLLISLVLCSISCGLSMRLSLEFDEKMTNLMMKNYQKYSKSKEARRLVDRIHMEYECCGVGSIDDLVDLSEVDTSLPPKTQLWSCSDWEYCSVPLSCCKSVECSQKVRFLVDGWDIDVMRDKWFWRSGCVAKMDNSLLLFNYPEHIITDFLLTLLVGFHLCAIVLTQILVTASATWHGAKLSSNSSDSSFAWLFGIGRPSMEELMKILNPDLKKSNISENLATERTEKTEEAIAESGAENPTETAEKLTETEKATENRHSEGGVTEKEPKLLGLLKVAPSEKSSDNPGKTEISTKPSEVTTTEKSTDKESKKPDKGDKEDKKKREKKKTPTKPKKSATGAKKKEKPKKKLVKKPASAKSTKKKSTAKKGKKK